MLRNKQLAEKAVIQATSLLVKLKISEGKLFKQVVSLMKIIAEIDGDKENVKKLESILN